MKYEVLHDIKVGEEIKKIGDFIEGKLDLEILETGKFIKKVEDTKAKKVENAATNPTEA